MITLGVGGGSDGVSLDDLVPLAWCCASNARIRFHSNKTVSVFMNGSTRRRKTLREAVAAHQAPPKRKR